MPESPATAEWLTIPEVAEATRLSCSTIRRLINSGDLAAYDMVGRIRVRRDDVEAWASSRPK